MITMKRSNWSGALVNWVCVFDKRRSSIFAVGLTPALAGLGFVDVKQIERVHGHGVLTFWDSVVRRLNLLLLLGDRSVELPTEEPGVPTPRSIPLGLLLGVS